MIGQLHASFVVVVGRGVEGVSKRIAALPETSHYKLTESAWLVDFEGTTRACAEALGVRGVGSETAGIAFPVSNYSGQFASEVWEWLSLHMTREGT